MLPKSKRLPRAQFAPLLASRSFFNSPSFTLRYAASSSGSKAAVSVSKKVSKKATDRNSIRRRVYSVLSQIPSFASSSGLFLFVAKSGSPLLKGEKLKEEISLLLKSAERSYNQ